MLFPTESEVNMSNANTTTATASSIPHLFDLFLDLPHPAASPSSPPPYIIPGPTFPPDKIQAFLPKIVGFVFPEFETNHPPPAPNPRSAGYNRFDVYSAASNADASQRLDSSEHFTFSLTDEHGNRIHGHVRRYLPCHLGVRSRYDVGRRGPRALVLLTKTTGADPLFAAMLKTIEATSSQQAVQTHVRLHNDMPQQWFLFQLLAQQQQLAKAYNRDGKPRTAVIHGLELDCEANPELRAKYHNVDVHRFILPTSVLSSTTTGFSNTSSIVPLLRCVGVAHALRILTALLSERRVILVSSSPTRLSVCSHAALSMLAQGLLHWQHLYIPVLPPHLWQYLAAPYPYLIGILTHTVPRLDRTDGLGEVLIIHLDTNQMETRGMEVATISNRLPDLFRSTMEQVQNQMPNTTVSPAEMLAQDLLEILKNDKRLLTGESALNQVGETAAKATKAVKNTFLKLRDKSKQYLQQRSSSGVGGERANKTSDDEDEDQARFGEDERAVTMDYIYTEGCHNEVAEESVRISFTSFFLCMFGDMRWYLSTPPNSDPVLDRNKFLQQRRALGDEGTPMWSLLNNFIHTQMLEEFAKARVMEIKNRVPVTPETPLFLQCMSYCRQHHVDFGVVNIRGITRQIAEASPTGLSGMLTTNARRTAMSLTSNKTLEGNYNSTLAQLVEECRESSSVLFDVMSVVWLRLRDCKGMQWKHGYQALQILRNLLYHGPLAAIAEATDGLSKIKALKKYENIRTQCAQQVRVAAEGVYILLTERAKLFHVRRVCAERRRIMQSTSEPRRIREPNTRLFIPFRNIHAIMNPSTARGTVVHIPSSAPTSQTMARGSAPPTAPVSAPLAEIDFFSTDLANEQRTDNPRVANDMASLFDSMAIAPSNNTSSSPNVFDTFGPATSVSTGVPAPISNMYTSIEAAPTAHSQAPLPQTSFQQQMPSTQAFPQQSDGKILQGNIARTIQPAQNVAQNTASQIQSHGFQQQSYQAQGNALQYPSQLHLRPQPVSMQPGQQAMSSQLAMGPLGGIQPAPLYPPVQQAPVQQQQQPTRNTSQFDPFAR